MPKKNNIEFLALIIPLAILIMPIKGTCDIHFYRAVPFFKEPRLEKPWLQSFDVWIGGGRTKKAHDGSKTKVALFDLYGVHQMQAVGDGICKDFAKRLDNLIIKLSLLNSSPGFATFSIEGQFSSIEAGIRYAQNFDKGLFLECYLPIRSLKIDNLTFLDLSSNDTYPNINDPYWIAFKNELPTIMQEHGVFVTDWKDHGCGDLVVLGGFTMSHQETQEIDFIDVTIQTGVSMPTGKKQDLSYAFALPFGYNKHWAIPVHFVSSIGAYEWLTVGMSIDALFLLAKSHEELRMKVSAQQSSILLLNKGQARVHPGTIWSVAPFIKADHVIRGLSLAVGYTYAHQKTTYITPFDKEQFNYAIVNSDERFAGYVLHTLHATAEYDFTQQNWQYGPRIGITYNHQISGKRCFKTYIASITAGLEIAWDF
ncbi:hypothetical protein EKK58_02740 [Candidatus Dependentiae bacterium]|nr:MAG: hypothetical protein EKK58_02740 [Candidatus Dependentiae bacterium]